MSSSDKFSGSSKGGENSLALKPVYKVITFEDTSQFNTTKVKYYGGPKTKSWTSFRKSEAYLDQEKVDRAIKDNPAPELVSAFHQMGPRRREILNSYLEGLNEKDNSEGMVGPWQLEHLFPGEDVKDKRSGAKIRSPTMFWVIVKRMKKMSGKVEDAKSGALKGILLKSGKSDDKSDSKSDSKSEGKGDFKGSGSSKGDDNKLLQQLIQAMTQMNTTNNGFSNMDIQSQIQTQVQMQMALLRQQQMQVPYMHSGLTPPPPYEFTLPMNAHNGLPQAPVAPGTSMVNSSYGMGSHHSPEHSPQILNGGFNGHPSSPFGFENQQGKLRRSSSRGRLADDADDYRGTHLDSPSSESPMYPRGGVGSRRHSISFGQYPYHEDIHQAKYAGSGFMPDMNTHISQWSARQPLALMGAPNMEPQQLRMLEAWNKNTSPSSSDCSDEDFRGRAGSRRDSVYSHDRARSRSHSRSSRMVDLSGGRRHAVNYPNMINGGMGLGKGFGMASSDDEMSMLHGMAIDRNSARTPFNEGLRR